MDHIQNTPAHGQSKENMKKIKKGDIKAYSKTMRLYRQKHTTCLVIKKPAARQPAGPVHR
jgi:hypothetical protein